MKHDCRRTSSRCAATSVSRSNEANSKKVNVGQIAVGRLSLAKAACGAAAGSCGEAHEMASIAADNRALKDSGTGM
ncbi:hypothetical protein GCM10023161_16660 [Mycobacterium paraffinicum]|uniref:Lipoprotein n=1 Tax=Mycobacterium paraffinicum TaxID=53378 RepID=A0ABP8RGH0_9MYCO